MQTFWYTPRLFPELAESWAECIRNDLRTVSVSVVRLYDEDSEEMDAYEQALSEAARSIRQDGGAPHGSRGMGGITRHYGLASSKAIVRARLDQMAKMVFSVLHRVDQRDLMCSWDAATITGVDAGRSRPPSHRVLNGTDYGKAFHELTGGPLKPHIDIGWGTAGDLVHQRMKGETGIDFPFCVPSQFICHSVPVGGATFIFATGVMRVRVVVVFGSLPPPTTVRFLCRIIHQ